MLKKIKQIVQKKIGTLQIQNDIKDLKENLGKTQNSILDQILFHQKVEKDKKLLTQLKNKYQKGQKLNLVFLVGSVSADLFSHAQFLEEIQKSEIFNLQIALRPVLGGISLNDSYMFKKWLQTYKEIQNFLPCLPLYNEEEQCFYPLEKFDIDLIVATKPWEGSLNHKNLFVGINSELANYNVEYLSQFFPTYLLYYGLQLMSGQHPSSPGGLDKIYNIPSLSCFTEILSLNHSHKELACQKNKMGGYHFSQPLGYPFWDLLLADITPDDKKVWKTQKEDTIKKIIWAPHWTTPLSEKAMAHFSNFIENYDFFTTYIKSQSKLEMLFRPHPNLFSQLSLYYDWTEAQYLEYQNRFNALGNAQSLVNGDVSSYFKTADGIILDSISFIGDAMLLEIPIIFLKSPSLNIEKNFNSFGQKILTGAYIVDGTNISEIKAMIEKVIINGEDPLAPKRKFLAENLLLKNKYKEKTASRRVREYLEDIILM